MDRKYPAVNRKSKVFVDFAVQDLHMKKDLCVSQILRRELKGKVLSRVAQDLGISVSLLHDWYRSARVPSGKNLWQLKKIATISV